MIRLGDHYAGAVFSEDMLHRYVLWRRLADDATDGCTLLACMLNPSKADHEESDSTVSALIVAIRRWNPDRVRLGLPPIVELRVVNLYSLRSTDPRGLWRHPDPVGPENDATIADEIDRAHVVLCGWGSAWATPERIERVRDLAGAHAQKFRCIGKTRSGAPEHPQSRRGTLQRCKELIPWPTP